MSLLVPMTLVGFTALSELVNSTLPTRAALAAAMTLVTPSTLVLTASVGESSQEETCLRAAV